MVSPTRSRTGSPRHMAHRRDMAHRRRAMRRPTPSNQDRKGIRSSHTHILSSRSSLTRSSNPTPRKRTPSRATRRRRNTRPARPLVRSLGKCFVQLPSCGVVKASSKKLVHSCLLHPCLQKHLRRFEVGCYWLRYME